jgi:hypothetical protein
MTVPHLDWPALHALLEAGDVPAVAAAFHGQNQGAHEELEQYVTAYWDALQWVALNSTSPSPWENRAAATQLAGVASAAAPGSAANWIGKNFPRPDDEVLSVLRGRDPQWLAELLHRLMERLERVRRLPDKLQADWSLVTRLAAQAGLALPSEDALAAGVYARSRSYLPWMKETSGPDRVRTGVLQRQRRLRAENCRGADGRGGAGPRGGGRHRSPDRRLPVPPPRRRHASRAGALPGVLPAAGAAARRAGGPDPCASSLAARWLSGGGRLGAGRAAPCGRRGPPRKVVTV